MSRLPNSLQLALHLFLLMLLTVNKHCLYSNQTTLQRQISILWLHPSLFPASATLGLKRRSQRARQKSQRCPLIHDSRPATLPSRTLVRSHPLQAARSQESVSAFHKLLQSQRLRRPSQALLVRCIQVLQPQCHLQTCKIVMQPRSDLAFPAQTIQNAFNTLAIPSVTWTIVPFTRPCSKIPTCLS